MSSSRSFSNRLSAMSEQQALIEAKRQAILKKVEERKKAQHELQDATRKDNEKEKTERGSQLLRQWGLKGKTKESQPNPSSSSSSSAQNKFSNDGSFLETFKKLQAEKESKQVQMKKESETPQMIKGEYGNDCPSSAVQFHEQPGTGIKGETKTEPDESKEWFQSAVDRAKRIAQSLAPRSKEQGQDSSKMYSAEGMSMKMSSHAFTSTGTKSEEVCSTAIKETMIPLPTVADELASLVAVNGDQVESLVREQNKAEVELMFLQEPESKLYQSYRAKVESLRRGMVSEQNENTKRERKSRWGVQDPKTSIPAPQTSNRDPQLVRYAMQVFGSCDLEDHQWKQCEEQMKMKMVYQDMIAAKARKDAMERSGKRQYEYDSDEDVEGGTWEHKARKLEMEKTANKAEELTEQGKGKHHIGDFLPPSELNKFLAKYDAIKKGETVVESDYEESKLNSSNLGFKMLQKMGWNEGSGLGSTSQGIVAPINQGNQSSDKKGLGVEKPHELEEQDDEFEAYRKRMMLAYRFRPNPLNNPRRQYY